MTGGTRDLKGAEAMPTEPDFELAVDQNKYLPADAAELHAILTVTASGGTGGQGIAGPAGTAEVILVDCSGSMGGAKMAAARRATMAAIDQLRDGVSFAVVEGSHDAQLVYPGSRSLATVSDETRVAAAREVARLRAGGGTAIGTWLSMARQLLAAHPAGVRHVILLTDGQNAEPRSKLERVLDECRDVFVCDARGVGADWRPSELLLIAEVLRGSARAVLDESGLAHDFAQMTRSAMEKSVADLRIRITTCGNARLRYCRQVFPAQADLADHADPLGDRTTEFRTAPWGVEQRAYHLALAIDKRDWLPREDMQAARIELRVAGQPAATAKPIVVHWTEDRTLSTRIPDSLAHYTGQAALRQAIEAGYGAYNTGDRSTAAREWGRALELAEAAGNEAVLAELRQLVYVETGGRAVLRSDLAQGEVKSIYLTGRVTTIAPGSPSPAEPAPAAAPDLDPDAPDLTCACGYVSPGTARYCTRCGVSLPQPDQREPSGGRSR